MDNSTEIGENMFDFYVDHISQSDRDRDERKKAYEEGCRQYLDMLDEWKRIPLNIAVIGNSGVGKSSFINAIRGLTADDEGAAELGETECTTDIPSYAHPNIRQLKFWDLPAVGTNNFPIYLDKIQIDRYDFFLLLSASRFTENDTWLCNEIEHRSRLRNIKPKLFVIRHRLPGVSHSRFEHSDGMPLGDRKLVHLRKKYLVDTSCVWRKIEYGGMNRPPTTSAKSYECDEKGDLRNIIEPSYGLLDNLLSYDVVKRREYNKILSEKPTLDRVHELLKIVSDKSDVAFDLLVDALRSTGQQHVVNYIHGRHEDNNDWPLNEGQRSKIERNADVLAENITVSEVFLMKLLSKSCITSMQKVDLQKVRNPSLLLLDLMRRRSVKHYEDFIVTLRQTGQHVAADVLFASQPSRYDPNNPLDQWLGIQHATESSAFDAEETATCEHASPDELVCTLQLSDNQPDGKKMVASQPSVLSQVEETRQLDAERVRILLHLLLFLYGGS